jgi:hypothetical protein
MYIAIFDSQPQGKAHGLQSNRFLKLPSCPLAERFPSQRPSLLESGDGGAECWIGRHSLLSG